MQGCDQWEAKIIGGYLRGWLPHLLKVLFIGALQFVATHSLV